MAAADAPPHPEDDFSGRLRGPALARGAARLLVNMGLVTLTEFMLGNGRRADVIALDGDGKVLIVEVKSSLLDYRSDRKWREYLDYCHWFFFAVDAEFPREVIPEDVGLIVADPFDAALLRDSPERKLAPARKRALNLAFAQTAALRLQAFTDPR